MLAILWISPSATRSWALLQPPPEPGVSKSVNTIAITKTWHLRDAFNITTDPSLTSSTASIMPPQRFIWLPKSKPFASEGNPDIAEFAGQPLQRLLMSVALRMPLQLLPRANVELMGMMVPRVPMMLSSFLELLGTVVSPSTEEVMAGGNVVPVLVDSPSVIQLPPSPPQLRLKQFAVSCKDSSLNYFIIWHFFAAKELPFRIQFISDNGEPAATEGALATVGFKIAYTMTSC